MHEYHKAVEWLESAKKQAEEKGINQVSVLHVTIGESSGYAPEVVKNYFDEAAVGTVCEGAKFDVNVTRSQLECPKCGKVYEKKLLDYACPDCGEEGNPTESGNELSLDSIE